MDTLGVRLFERRKELKLTQKNLAKSIGVSHVTISQWEKEETSPKGGNLIALSKALQCSPDWLLAGKEKKPAKPEENAEWLGDLKTWDSGTALGDDEVALPFFTEVQLSAGNGATQVQENYGPKLRFAKSTLRSRGVSPHNAACVKVSGSSMEPVLPDGSTVGVDTSKTQIIDGKMFAIDHEGMLRVKTLYKVPGGVRFRSFNQAEYPDETHTGEGFKHVRIIGQVFWYSVLI